MIIFYSYKNKWMAQWTEKEDYYNTATCSIFFKGNHFNNYVHLIISAWLIEI